MKVVNRSFRSFHITKEYIYFRKTRFWVEKNNMCLNWAYLEQIK